VGCRGARVCGYWLGTSSATCSHLGFPHTSAARREPSAHSAAAPLQPHQPAPASPTSRTSPAAHLRVQGLVEVGLARVEAVAPQHHGPAAAGGRGQEGGGRRFGAGGGR
jgi:hypothetical protein